MATTCSIPHKLSYWHRNHPQPNRKYIREFPKEQVRERHRQAVARLRLLLRGDTGQRLGRYGLGKKRSLEQYRLFSGLDCKNLTIHLDAVNGVPPNPNTIQDVIQTSRPIEDNAHDEPLIEVSVFLKDAQPVELSCPRDAPILQDLFDALGSNNSLSANSEDALMYLGFEEDGHEIYFLKSQITHIKTRGLG